MAELLDLTVVSDSLDDTDEPRSSSTDTCELFSPETMVTLLPPLLLTASGWGEPLDTELAKASGVISFVLTGRCPSVCSSVSSTSVLASVPVSTPLKSDNASWITAQTNRHKKLKPNFLMTQGNLK